MGTGPRCVLRTPGKQQKSCDPGCLAEGQSPAMANTPVIESSGRFQRRGRAPLSPRSKKQMRKNREVGVRGRGGSHHHCGSVAQDARRGLLSLGKTWLEPAPAPIVSTVRQDGTRGITVHRPGFPHQAGRRKEDSGQSSRGALLRSPTTVAYLTR